MAEWLRRLTRNQMGSSLASSNLADCVVFLSEHKQVQMFKIIKLLWESQQFGLSSHGRVVKASD